MGLIDKSDVVAEIERRIKINKECMLGLRKLNYYQGKVDALNDTISFLNTLEVKEVDLEKEANKAWNYIFSHGWDENSRMALKHDEYMAFAQHFFELGLKAHKG